MNSNIIASAVLRFRCESKLPEIKVYFDYVCPYCLIAHVNAHRFQAKFPNVRFNWKPWEICPETPPNGITADSGCVSPTLAKLSEEAGFQMHSPSIQPNSHLALMSLFYAEERGKLEQYNSGVFKALWDESKNIGELHTLSRIMGDIGLDSKEFQQSIVADHEKYASMLEESESDAINDNIQLAPTFLFGQKRIVGNVSARRVEKFIGHIATSKD
jgi:predicted DsbA family dithiol-disulfide isomerase